MPYVVSSIRTLSQHFLAIKENPEIYRPPRCVHCGRAGLHCHGYYERKGFRDSANTNRNPVRILRFLCRSCRRTCSSLPACLSPRRWFRWLVQQVALLAVLSGNSYEQAAERVDVSSDTVGRWFRWLTDRQLVFSMALRARYVELGRAVDLASFWQQCFRSIGLASAMATLSLDYPTIP